MSRNVYATYQTNSGRRIRYKARQEKIAAVTAVSGRRTLDITAYTTSLTGRFGIRTRILNLTRTDNTVSPPVVRTAIVPVPLASQWSSINTNNNFAYAGFTWRVASKGLEQLS